MLILACFSTDMAKLHGIWLITKIYFGSLFGIDGVVAY
jgi:hypothetical protein